MWNYRDWPWQEMGWWPEPHCCSYRCYMSCFRVLFIQHGLKMTITHTVWRIFFFSIFDDQNLGCCCFFFSLLLFRLQSTSWKERVFSLECFCNWRNDFLDLSRSLLLHCVVLVIFDPLYIYIAVVSQEDLSEVLWALPDEMFPELPAIAKTEYRPSWSHPSCVPSVPTYPPYKQRIRVCFKSPFEHPCLNSASAASTFISDWRCHSGTV